MDGGPDGDGAVDVELESVPEEVLKRPHEDPLRPQDKGVLPVRELQLDLVAMTIRHGAHLVDQVLDRIRDVERHEGVGIVPLFQPGKVQHVVDLFERHAGGPVGDAGQTALALIRVCRDPERVDRGDGTGDRCPHLVAHDGKEAAAGLRGLDGGIPRVPQFAAAARQLRRVPEQEQDRQQEDADQKEGDHGELL